MTAQPLIGLAALALALTASSAAFAQASPSAGTYATRYDLLRREVGTITPDPDGAGPLPFLATRKTYSAAGHLTKVETGTLASWQSESVAPANWTGFAVVSQVDTTFDAMGRKVREAVSGGGLTSGVTEYGYDLAGRLKCTAVRMNPDVWATPLADKCVPGTAHAVHGPDRITRNSYTVHGEILKVEKAVGTGLQQVYASYTYSPNGKQTSVTDGNGNRAEMTYDGLDRQKRWIFPSKTVPGAANPADYEEYGYDSNANRTSLRKRDNVTLNYAYDALNRMTQKTVPASATGAAGYGVFYGYDLRGLQTFARFGSASGPGVANAWDGFGRLASSVTTMDGASRALSNQYDADGNRILLSGDSGYYAPFSYDGLGRMKAYADVFQLGYDSAGRRSSLNMGQGWISSTVGYSYDPAGRLQTLSHDLGGTSGDQVLGFAYNPASQIVSRSGSNDAYASNTAYGVVRPYSVNGLNQYTSAGPAAFAYDANGNLTSDGSATFVYDAENRLVSASGAKNASLAYDPLGRLWQVASGASVTRFIYDGDRLLMEYNGAGAATRSYVHGPGTDEPLAWYEAALGWARRFLHADHQGSIVALNDDSGTPVAINGYDAWGIPNAGNAGRFGYTGQAWIPELGLWYYKARFYSPTTGRFLQVDPVGYKDQMNLYAYVGNDPVNAVDPTGTTCESVDQQSNRAPRCKIDGVAIVNRQGRTTGSRPATPQEERRFAAFNNKYTQAYNRLLSRGDREVTVRGFGRRDQEGSFSTSAAKMAEALRTRQVLYAPDNAPRGGAMATSGGPGEGRTPTTFVFDFSLRNPARGDIAHEIGLHGTAEEMSGRLQTPDRQLGGRLQTEHQQPYQDAACAALGGNHCD